MPRDKKKSAFLSKKKKPTRKPPTRVVVRGAQTGRKAAPADTATRPAERAPAQRAPAQRTPAQRTPARAQALTPALTRAFSPAVPSRARTPAEDLTGQAKSFLAHQRALKTAEEPARQVVPARDAPPVLVEPVLAPVLPPVPGDGVKTKRQMLTISAAGTDEALVRQGVEANKAALKRIYEAFYDQADGSRLSGQDRLDRIYNMMGEGTAEYVQTPVTDEEFGDFLKLRPDIFIQAQESDFPKNATREQREQVLREAVQEGDYFHVHNVSKLYTKAHPSGDRAAGLGKLARRIVVNVKTQEAGLKVAGKMAALMDDPLVSPNMRQFKIYLSKEVPTGETTVKHDKLVIYYQLPPGTGDTTSDPVGDKIVAAVGEAVGEEEMGSDLAPYYARLGPGVAWAEEPKYFVGELDNSFTESRAEVISNVINDNDTVPTLAGFLDKVTAALRGKFIDPAQPHRHLPGAKSLEQVRAEKEAARLEAERVAQEAAAREAERVKVATAQFEVAEAQIAQRFQPSYQSALSRYQQAVEQADRRRQAAIENSTVSQRQRSLWQQREETMQELEDSQISRYEADVRSIADRYQRELAAVRQQLNI
ncbi:hypothetical protein J4573_31585 [Actinomadura barringtoniae]|uniref:Uncharacterized protein n=1 Tax=Actinomadura barringtoniae TaxID=1427535 RepID=A0A939PFN8_9ACTN|nr:hypothetical protein [Actinomadura barringtoniae]MBO2451670.1 hypothetical protein [Actinomadura barringtoniae]